MTGYRIVSKYFSKSQKKKVSIFLTLYSYKKRQMNKEYDFYSLYQFYGLFNQRISDENLLKRVEIGMRTAKRKPKEKKEPKKKIFLYG